MKKFIWAAAGVLLAAKAVLAQTPIGEVATTWKLLGNSDRVVVERFDDPKVENVSCYISRAVTGVLNLWPNQKNRAFEDRTGFITNDAEQVVRRLNYKDYSQGPEDDDNPTRPEGKVWVFRTEYFGESIYLKLKLVGTAGSHTEAACLSFHEPEREMKTPLKVNRQRTAPQAKRPGRHG